MLRFKEGVDILARLKEVGVTSTSSRESKALSQGTFTKLKTGVFPDRSIGLICDILKCQPGDIIEWIPDETE